MKKAVTLLITMIILLNIICVCASDFTLTVDSRTAQPGDTVKIDLTISGNTGIIAAIFTLEYDKNRIELIVAEDKALLEGAIFSESYDKYPYKMLWNSSSAENFTSDGTLVTLTFKVKENAQNGDANINITYNADDVFDKDLENVAVNIINGNIKVEKEETLSSGTNSGGYIKPSLPHKSEEITKEDIKVISYDDVHESDWYHSAVKYVSDNNLMNGVSDKKFAPQSPLTRGMLVTVLYRNEAEPQVTAENTFKDVDNGSYYSEAVTWGYENKIVNGISEEHFAPERYITRQEIATIFYRYAAYKNYDINFKNTSDLHIYTDSADIAGYASNAVAYAVNSGLLKGKSETTINPTDVSTRAETAAMLMRFIEMYK